MLRQTFNCPYCNQSFEVEVEDVWGLPLQPFEDAAYLATLSDDEKITCPHCGKKYFVILGEDSDFGPTFRLLPPPEEQN